MTAVGARIRQLRTQRRLSQTQLAASTQLSGSYISLIEAGRRPVTARALEAIADSLGCSVSYLQTGRGGPGYETVELDLRFGELALREGDAQAALERFVKVQALAEQETLEQVGAHAKWGAARARESLGDLESAIADYEILVRDQMLPDDLNRVTIETALCRAYSECGDLARAIDVGETALARIEQANDDLSGDAQVGLASTLAGCYYERGDLTRAQLLAGTAIARAEGSGSPRARAAAYWNAGLVAEARGNLRTARSFVDRAHALYSEGDNARAIALLKITRAWLLLRASDHPDVPEAERLLRYALASLPTVGTQLDVAYGETELARCHLLHGDWQGAVALAEGALERMGDGPRIEAARARLVCGHALFHGGDVDGAVGFYTDAAGDLRKAGAVRQAASAWRELADALTEMDRTDEALEAYRYAADAAGVTAAPYTLATVIRSTVEVLPDHRQPQHSAD